MKRVMSAMLCVALAGLTCGEEKKPAKNKLPREDTVKWDVTVLEDSPAYEVAKREVKGNTVTWVLENKRSLGTEIIFGYQAALYDADGVRVGTIEIVVDPFLMNMSQGERNRFSLHLPQPEKWQGVRKVVIKNGR